MTARILVIDDTASNRKLFKHKLEQKYYQVELAASGHEALKILEKETIDLIILDVMMPIMDGFEVCKKIRSNPKTSLTPIIMATALRDSENRIKGLKCGADDFLCKPIDDTSLFARIRSLLRLKMIMDEWILRDNAAKKFSLEGRQEPPMADVKSGNASIYIFENNQADEKLLQEILRSEKNIVSRLNSSEELIETVKTQDIDILIISLEVTDIDALKLCSKLRSDNHSRYLPILITAEQTNSERLALALDLGVNDYIIKPIEPSEVIARARTLIKRKRFQEKLKENYETSLSLALTDSLTGIYNRRYLLNHLEHKIEAALTTDKPLSVMVLDIDHFKKINDTYGHDAGDQVLIELTQRIEKNIRNIDIVARLGGEEFVIVVPDLNPEQALDMANRLRRVIAEEVFTFTKKDLQISVTVSIGVATTCKATQSQDQLLKHADLALYEAKENGRNIVTQHNLGAPTSPAHETREKA